MASVRRSRRRRSSRDKNAASAHERLPKLALALFAAIVVVAPLAFGAVDRFVQCLLLGLFTLGLLIYPPALVRLDRRANVIVLSLVVLFLLKEFGPAQLFGIPDWRKTLSESFGVVFPWTHHPEPGRALDSLLALSAGALWFLWVRTLAAERAARPWLLWILLAAAAIVTLVSFTGLRAQGDTMSLFGWQRYTAGWRGFGPFPNRNHTACLLAMGAVVGCGCIVWSGTKRKQALIVAAFAMTALCVCGILATESRGGIVALVVGLIVFAALSLAKARNARALAAVGASALMLMGLAFAYGPDAFARFSAADSAGSTAQRVTIWQDTFAMWKDAPVFGHGLDSFRSVYPMYQTVWVDNAIVLHPESSLMQWLSELGLLFLLAGAIGLGWFLLRHLSAAYKQHRSFYLLAGGFGAIAVLLCHSLFDVPAHRWGTVIFALAALAVAAPYRSGSGSEEHAPGEEAEEGEEPRPAPPPSAPLVRASRAVALVPLCIAGFWGFCLVSAWPAWSPLTLQRTIARLTLGQRPSAEELRELLRFFPLQPALHQALGDRMIAGRVPGGDRWSERFRTAIRLSPAQWPTAVAIARSAMRVSPGRSLNFWQQAIERAGWRRADVFQTALRETAKLPAAAAAWEQYAEANPDLLLPLAQTVPPENGRPAFERWWQLRAASPDLREYEIRAFHGLARAWASDAQLQQWMELHRPWEDRDFREWAVLLHARGNHEAAWRLLRRRLPEPEYPTPRATASREILESRWRAAGGAVMAQDLADVHDQAGNKTAARDVILKQARSDDSPPWFKRKAAHLLAQQGEFKEAVDFLLNADQPTAPR